MAIDNSSQRRSKNRRSPSFPWIDLRKAIDMARAFYREERRNVAPVPVAVKHWGYNPTSSSGHLCLSALKKFGLLEDEGSKESRQVRLTDLAFSILLDEREVSPERDEALRRAALMPKIHEELWQRYGTDLPSTGTLRTYLVLQREFTEDAADDLIKEYKATIAFARLDSDGTIAGDASDSNDEDEVPYRENPASPVDRTPGDSMLATTPNYAVKAAEFPPLSLPTPVRQLSIPLEDGKTFDLRFPLDLSKEDFDFVLENIKLWERKIVAKRSEANRPEVSEDKG